MSYCRLALAGWPWREASLEGSSARAASGSRGETDRERRPHPSRRVARSLPSLDPFPPPPPLGRPSLARSLAESSERRDRSSRLGPLVRASAGGAAGRWGRAARYNDRRLPACRCARAPSCAVPGHPCELEAPASASRRQKRLACVLVRGVLRRLLRRPDLWRSSLKRVALSTISLDSALRQPASQQRAGWPTAG